MKNFLVIGNPVDHSLSPKLHREIYRQLGIEASYEKLELKEKKIPEILAKLKAGDLHGINVTIPYKETILRLLDDIAPKAKNIGSVNCVSIHADKVTGHNTDSVGFTNVLGLRQVPIAGQHFVVMGAGGSARSVVYALLRSMAGKVTVINRTDKRAAKLISDMKPFNESTSLITSPIDAIDTSVPLTWINCTPLGMGSLQEKSPVPIDYIQSNHHVMDLVYQPLRTTFIKEADRKNANVITGLDLLIEQGLESCRIWFGRDISSEVTRSLLISSLLIG